MHETQHASALNCTLTVGLRQVGGGHESPRIAHLHVPLPGQPAALSLCLRRTKPTGRLHRSVAQKKRRIWGQHLWA